MAEYYRYSIEISGSYKELEGFQDQVKGKGCNGQVYPLLLRSLVPEPSPDMKWSEQSEWRMGNWGTARDLDECQSSTEIEVSLVGEPKAATLVYEFDAAWQPPDLWVAAVQKQFPNLEFTL